MSTNYTSHYNLCQWEPSDPVLRTDFNADNAKLDAALLSHTRAIDQVRDLALSETARIRWKLIWATSPKP